MRRSIIIGILSIVLTAGFSRAADKVDTSSLPPAVQRTINEWKGEGEINKVKTLQQGGATVYEVDFKERGDEKRILVRPDGSVLGDEQFIGKGKGKDKDKGEEDRGQGKKGKGKAKGQKKNRGQDEEERTPATAPVVTQPAPTPATPPVVTQPPMPAPVERPVARPQPAPRVPAPAKPSVENGQPATPATTSAPQPTTKPAPRVPQPPPVNSAPESAQPATPAGTLPQAQTQLENRIRLVNGQDQTAATRKVALAAVSKETGVSVTTLERDAKRYAVGVGGLLVAHDIAKRTKKPASTYFLEHVRGASWDRIAAEAKIDIKTVLPKLERVQQTIQTSATEPSTTTRKRRSLF